MTAKIIDGKEIAGKILSKLKIEIAKLKKENKIPKLVVIQVGDDPASTIYVNKKHETCKKIGIASEVKRLPENIEYKDFLMEIGKLNKDDKVHGIMIQIPLPKHLNNKQVFETVAVEKDVDGLHPFSHGKNLLGKGGFQPATPIGIMELLKHTGVKIEGSNAVVVGRSNIVGKPISIMLLNKGAPVTVCHSKTQDLGEHTKKADILITAVGKEGLIKADMVKKGAIVIDVGIMKLDSGKIVGDVDFEKVKEKAAWITPVPGGVGPMTIASLMLNTIKACREQENV